MDQERLLFPVTDSEDFVSIAELPANANEVLELLRMELVPLKLWRAIAMEYTRKGNFENAEIILRAGCDREVQSVPVYAQETSDQVALFNSLAAWLSQQAAFAGKPHLLGEARELHERGSLIEMLNQYTWVGKGHTLVCNYLASGGPELLTQAVKQFQIAIDDPTGTCALIAHLGKAHALLLQKNYKQALDEYRYVLRHAGDQNQARIGIGICQFHLGRPGKAAEAFKRALAVDPESIEAMLGLASVTDVDLIARALAIDSSNPGVVALVALHLLVDLGESVKAESLARKALQLTNSSGSTSSPRKCCRHISTASSISSSLRDLTAISPRRMLSLSSCSSNKYFLASSKFSGLKELWFLQVEKTFFRSHIWIVLDW